MNINIGDMLLLHKDSKKTAIIYGSETISYSNLYKIIEKHSEVYSKCMIKEKCIGIFLPNSLYYIIAYFLIANMNKVIIPINPNLKSDEVKSQVNYCELQLIITDSTHINTLKEKINGLEYKIIIYFIDRMIFEEMGESRNSNIISDYSELDNVALMLHTSGSLSKPKIVMLTNDNLLSCTKSIIESLQINRFDKTLVALPLFLASANTSQLLTHIYLGATIVIMDAYFTPQYFFKLVEKHRITNFTGVPYMMNLLLESKKNVSYDLSSLRYICFGGAPSTTENIRKLISLYPNIDFIHMYGQTEVSTRISHLLPQYSITKLGSVGKPIPGLDLRLVDSVGVDVKVGDIGEVIVKGDSVMKGYYKRKQETDEVIKDGWLYTGDLGKFDEEKFLYLTGRI